MRIQFICLGKTQDKRIMEMSQSFINQLPNYIKWEWIEVDAPKLSQKLSKQEVQDKEWQVLEKCFSPTDVVYLLDEKGKQYTSTEFSAFLHNQMINSVKTLVFVVGGAYGFPPTVKHGKYGLISLSKMTFTHQMIRLFCIEQIYRAFSIIEGKPYHNE